MKTTGSKFNQASEVVRFTVPHVFLAFESAQEELEVRVSVMFGHDQHQKKNNVLSNEQKNMVENIEEEYNRRMARGNQSVLHTAARNARQHQNRIKLQIENMVNDKKQAKKFIATMMERKAKLKEEVQITRDFITENRHDAVVWKDLDNFQKAENADQSQLRQQTVQAKHKSIVENGQREAAESLGDREQVKKIRAFIRQRLDEIRQNRERLRQVLGHIVNCYMVTELWQRFDTRKTEIKRARQLVESVLYISMMYKRKIIKRARTFKKRQITNIRHCMTVAANSTFKSAELRAKKSLAGFFASNHSSIMLDGLF